MPLRARQTETDCIGDLFGHRRQREAPVEAETLATEVLPGVLVEVEGVELAAEAQCKVPQQLVDRAEMRKVVGVHTTGGDGLMAAACQPG